MRKHKRLARLHKTRSAKTLKRLAQRQPRAFDRSWSMGYLSRMDDGSRMS